MKNSNNKIQSRVMKMAWVIFRNNNDRTMEAWSESLKMAWKLAKSEKEAYEMAEDEGFQTHGYQEYWYKFQFNHWMRGDRNRVYLNLDYGRSRKWSRGVSYCIDLNNGSISDVSRKYNNAHERTVVSWIAERVVSHFVN